MVRAAYEIRIVFGLAGITGPSLGYATLSHRRTTRGRALFRTTAAGSNGTAPAHAPYPARRPWRQGFVSR